jgi:hypothetical protein
MQVAEAAAVAVQAVLATPQAQHGKPSTRWFTVMRKQNLHPIHAGRASFPNSKTYSRTRKLLSKTFQVIY